MSTKLASFVLVTPRIQPLFQAQSPGHNPKWNESLESSKVKGDNDAKANS